MEEVRSHGVYSGQLGDTHSHGWLLLRRGIDEVWPQKGAHSRGNHRVYWRWNNYNTTLLCDHNRKAYLRLQLWTDSYYNAESDGGNHTRRIGGNVWWTLLPVIRVCDTGGVWNGSISTTRIKQGATCTITRNLSDIRASNRFLHDIARSAVFLPQGRYLEVPNSFWVKSSKLEGDRLDLR